MHANNNAYATCVACSEVITNPVCTDCLGMEMSQWLSEKEGKCIGTYAVSSEKTIGVSCVLCHTAMNLCSRCFAKEELQAMGFESEEMKEEFYTYFDYFLGS